MLHIFALLLGCSEEPDATPVYSEEDNKPRLVSSEDPVNQLEMRSDVKPKQLTSANIDNYTIVLPKRTNKNIFISPLNQPQQDMIKVLKNVLEQYALQGDDPWAMGHALMALGATEKTVTGKSVIDAIFEYAELENIHGKPLPVFPREHKSPHRTIPIEPHKDLMMKVMIEFS